MDLEQLRIETRNEILDCLDIYQEVDGTGCSVSVETLVDALRAERIEVQHQYRLVDALENERDAARAQALAYVTDLRAALSDAATVRIALGCLMNEHPPFRDSRSMALCECCCCRQARAALGDTFTGQGAPPCQFQMPIADPRAAVLAELHETRVANAELWTERDAYRVALAWYADPDHYEGALVSELVERSISAISQKANGDGN